jgi:hypothetical protein
MSWAQIIEKRCARAAQANKREQVEGGSPTGTLEGGLDVGTTG